MNVKDVISMNTANTNNFPTTPEEDFAFQQLEKKLMTTPTLPIPLVETPSTTIQSHTGAQYQAMDFSPNKRIQPEDIVNQIAGLLAQLVSVITPAPTPQPNFHETVETILEQSNWFEIMLDKKIEAAVEDAMSTLDLEKQIRAEVEDMIGDEISHYMHHHFDINNHVNIADKVSDILDDTLSDAVDSALDDKLEDAITEVLSDKTITINL